MKTCKKCGQEKELSEFSNKSSEKDGKHRYCKQCMAIDVKNYYQTSGRKESDYYKNYQEENREYFREKSKDHYHSNKELYREWQRNSMKNDPFSSIKRTTNNKINSALKTYHELEKDKTVEYLGCSISEYLHYLESQFDDKMAWDNKGNYWEIAHIKLVKEFDFNNPEEMAAYFNYKNTEPRVK